MSEEFRRRLPNMLTLFRLVLAVGFFASLNAYRYPSENILWAAIAIALFIAAAVTDAFDGHLARKWQVMSTFGRLMDPFCDKVLVLGAFIYLAGPRFLVPEWVEDGSFFTMATGVYPWMVVLILTRELLVTGIRGVIESMGVSCGSKWSGKAKMILQSIAIPTIIFVVIVFRPGENSWALRVCDVLIYATVIVTVWSGLPYVLAMRATLAKLKEIDEKDKKEEGSAQ